MNRNIRLLIISLFIIGFPAVSWYYLNQGYNYRIGIIEELDQKLGRVPDFQFTNQFGEKITNDDMSKSVVITNFLDMETIAESENYMSKLYKIQDQFDKKDDILFYTYFKADNVDDVRQYIGNLKIKEEKQWHFLTGEDNQMAEFVQNFPFPENISKTYTENATVAIVDTSSVIRYFYNLNEDKEAGKLVEHIANLMPQAPPEEARMKRELEK